MPDFKKQQFDKDPFTLINSLQKNFDELKRKIDSERFSSRDRLIRELAIAKNGKFRIEEKDSLPTKATVGEITVYLDRLFLCTATDTWNLVGTPPTRTISAGTAADSPTSADGLIQANTNGSQALTITVPEAANNLGLTLTVYFDTDGGQNVTIARTGSDTFDDSGDLGNTSVTMQDSGDMIQIMAVEDDTWMVIKNIGCTLT